MDLGTTVPFGNFRPNIPSTAASPVPARGQPSNRTVEDLLFINDLVEKYNKKMGDLAMFFHVMSHEEQKLEFVDRVPLLHSMSTSLSASVAELEVQQPIERSFIAEMLKDLQQRAEDVLRVVDVHKMALDF